MARSHQAPKGTFDILPAEETVREEIEGQARQVLGRAGYGRVETPAFEDTELFARSVGEATDIVRKEMWTFEDKGGRSVTLRPEGTAPVCRAYVEHGMHKLPQPVRLWYLGPFFRYEAPQAGRFRQFTQIGAEAIGSAEPQVDAELIVLLEEVLRGLGVPDLELRLASLGSPGSRKDYTEELKEYLRRHEKDLSKEVRERIDLNPLRAFDSDHQGTRAVMANAPTMLDRLEGEDAEHFAAVQRLLETAGVAYTLDGTLVRGLDYYTRTVFEFNCERLGTQSQVGGGGRYDALVKELGGPDTPAAGWAAGVERIVLALGERETGAHRDAFVAAASNEDRERAFALVGELRRAGLSAETDLAGRSMKGQMRHADRVGARWAVILDGARAELRDMQSGEQREVEVSEVASALGAEESG